MELKTAAIELKTSVKKCELDWKTEFDSKSNSENFKNTLNNNDGKHNKCDLDIKGENILEENEELNIRLNVFAGLNCELLQTLNLCKTGIVTIEEDFFGNLPNLRSLDISFNKLTALPDSIGHLEHLVNLDISGNKLNSLPVSCTSLNKLRSFNLSYNKFATVPECIRQGMLVIAKLNLSRNSLNEFDSVPACYQYLRELNLSKNVNLKLPFWIFQVNYNFLKVLDLSCTSFSSGLSSLKFYRSFHMVDIYANLISLNISQTGRYSSLNFLNQMPNLKMLSIGHNRIHYKESNKYLNVIEGISKSNIASGIVELYVPNCDLFSLPNEFDRFVNLRILDLSSNNISWFPTTFTSLTNLRKCILSENDFVVLPDDLDKLISLEELYLDDNKLECLPESVFKLKQMKYLDLYNNKLHKLPLQIIDMNLNGADISENSYQEDINNCDPEFIKMYNQLQINFRAFKNVSRDNSQLVSCNAYCESEDTDNFKYTEDTDEDEDIIVNKSTDEEDEAIDIIKKTDSKKDLFVPIDEDDAVPRINRMTLDNWQDMFNSLNEHVYDPSKFHPSVIGTRNKGNLNYDILDKFDEEDFK